MAKPVMGLTVFGALASAPVSQLDSNIAALQNAINDFGTFSNFLVDSSGAPNVIVGTTTAGIAFAYLQGIHHPDLRTLSGSLNPCRTPNPSLTSLASFKSIPR